MTLRTIRTMLSDAYRRTAFFRRTNETYYPAEWSYGEGAGDASTSCPYDCRVTLAVQHVASELELDMDAEIGYGEPRRLRDWADIIAAAYRAREVRDAAVDATLDLPLVGGK